MWSTHTIILAPKILIFPPSFKIICSIIVLLLPRPAHYIRCNFNNTIAGREPVGSILWPSDYGCGDKYRPKLIQYVDGREPQIHEV